MAGRRPLPASQSTWIASKSFDALPARRCGSADNSREREIPWQVGSVPTSLGNKDDMIRSEPQRFAPRQRLRAFDPSRLASALSWIVIVSVSLGLPTIASAAPWPIKLLHRMVAPFRSNAFLQDRVAPCSLGFAKCFLPDPPTLPPPPMSKPDQPPAIEDPDRITSLELRALHRGPFAHHWLEFETSNGKIALGFGPATVPFIDAGQISLQDTYGNIERISGMHPLLVLGLPPLNYRYAKSPGSGHTIGKPIPMTIDQADALVQKIHHRKFVGPYIPFFHDCRTFVCSVQAAEQGRSSLPCYVLFKGYW